MTGSATSAAVSPPMILVALVLLGFYKFYVRVVPYRFWNREVLSPGTVSTQSPANPGRVQSLVAAIDTASRIRPFGPTCLVRVLALRRLLLISGIASSVVLAARTSPGSLPEAHAWLEVDGQAVTPTHDQYRRFTPVTGCSVR